MDGCEAHQCLYAARRQLEKARRSRDRRWAANAAGNVAYFRDKLTEALVALGKKSEHPATWRRACWVAHVRAVRRDLAEQWRWQANKATRIAFLEAGLRRGMRKDGRPYARGTLGFYRRELDDWRSRYATSLQALQELVDTPTCTFREYRATAPGPPARYLAAVDELTRTFRYQLMRLSEAVEGFVEEHGPSFLIAGTEDRWEDQVSALVAELRAKVEELPTLLRPAPRLEEAWLRRQLEGLEEGA